jgi:hypothetical protein
MMSRGGSSSRKHGGNSDSHGNSGSDGGTQIRRTAARVVVLVTEMIARKDNRWTLPLLDASGCQTRLRALINQVVT